MSVSKEAPPQLQIAPSPQDKSARTKQYDFILRVRFLMQGLGTNNVYWSIWFLGKTNQWFWFCILQMLLEISISTNKNQQKKVLLLQIFQMSYFVLKYFPHI